MHITLEGKGDTFVLNASRRLTVLTEVLDLFLLRSTVPGVLHTCTILFGGSANLSCWPVFVLFWILGALLLLMSHSFDLLSPVDLPGWMVLWIDEI